MGQRLVPRRIVVKQNIEARYTADGRPVSWNRRAPGVEKVLTVDGEVVLLHSSGGQSSPVAGWELLLTKEVPAGGYLWTLYGITPQSPKTPD